MRKKNFEIEINGLRGIAITLVVLFHFEIYPFSGGFIGVDIFFVISGYLIGKIIEKKPISFINYKKYILNRIRRIFPGILVLILISFFFSLLLFFIGILAEYVLAIHQKLYSRQIVIEKERINFQDTNKFQS